MEYEILQLKADKPGYRFMEYDFAKKWGFDLDDYDVVYGGRLDDAIASDEAKLNAWMDNLFNDFNVNIPTGFGGHSLSVSDIIRLGDGRMFYVDAFGFIEIQG